MNKSLPGPQIDWKGVFDALGGDDALLKAKAVHRLACGLSAAQIADEIGVSVQVVRDWQTEPSFQKALDLIRENFADYLESGLNHAIVQAREYVEWVLAINPLGAEVPKELKKDILREKGLAARMILEKTVFDHGGSGKGVTVNMTQPVFNITPSAAQVLASRLPQMIDVSPQALPDHAQETADLESESNSES